MNMELINNDLLSLQLDWWNNIVMPEFEKGIIPKPCCPFSFGVSRHYFDGKKKLMYVGQETKGYNDWQLLDYRNDDFRFIDADGRIINSIDNQNFSIDYFDFQLDRTIRCKSNRYKYNRSPFWNGIRNLKNDGYTICWNDINKIENIKAGFANVLNSPLPSYGESLFKIELELAASDAVLLASGDKYIDSIISIFGIDEFYKESLIKELHNKIVVDLTDCSKFEIPIVWTFHPNHLIHLKEYKTAFCAIKCVLSKRMAAQSFKFNHEQFAF